MRPCCILCESFNSITVDSPVGLGWAGFNVPLNTFLGHFGDSGVTAASARIVATVRAHVCAVLLLSSVCATTVDNSGVYVYYFKGFVSICFRCPARTVGFSGTRPYLCVYSQPSWLDGSTRGLQLGGHVHKEAVHLLSIQPASTTSLGAFKPECNGLSQFREDTGGHSMPVLLPKKG